MDTELWELLHDGTITNLARMATGELRISLEIDYIRQMFDGDGTSLLVYLTDCDVLRYVPYDGSLPISDFEQLVQEELSFICARDEDGQVKVSCGYGDVCLRYGVARVELDNERSITRRELEDACSRYWDAFAKWNAPN